MITDSFILDNKSFTGQMITLDGGEHLKWLTRKNEYFIWGITDNIITINNETINDNCMNN